MAHYSEDLGAFSVSRDGVIVMASPRALQMTGYELFDLMGKPFADFIDEQSLPKAMATFAQVLEGETTDVELEIRKKDGGTVKVRARTEPDRVGDDVLGAVGTLEELKP